MRGNHWIVAVALVAASTSCSPEKDVVQHPGVMERPTILLVTLDTTRSDSIGPEAKGIDTPSFNALAARGERFRQAYTPVPQTLAAHTSILTGLYPAGHGIHENGRYVSPAQSLLQERLKAGGYRTAAFVSAFALARRFGLARGFDVYDDEFGGERVERSASETTDHVLSYLKTSPQQPQFIWVHYYDPHFPYAPPEPYRTRYDQTPYLGEIASMDAQLGRLVQEFDRAVKGPKAIIVVGDHGEGLGDHGEAQHGNLLYQSTVHVPLLLVGPGVRPSNVDSPVSTRRIFQTILDWAGIDSANSLRAKSTEVVLGEAMKPFLDYGWQPQVMTIEGPQKTILAGRTEVYNVVADPAETHDLSGTATLSREVRAALREYPVPSLKEAATAGALGDEERKKLASLGYVAAETKPVIRKDAPRPAEMAALFPDLDRAAELFVHEDYARAIPLLATILAADPYNLDAALRLASAHSQLGHEQEAEAAFKHAQQIAPDSPDVQTYFALHYARGKDWERAVPMLEKIVAESPDRLPALEALAVVRERQGRFPEAIQLREKIYSMRTPTAGDLVRMGSLAMASGQTDVGVDAFERARRLQGADFRNNLELGVLYLSQRRFQEARDALDRVAASDAGYPMALFKRAQVSVLLNEPDRSDRIESARRHADATTRSLIARERLFTGNGG